MANELTFRALVVREISTGESDKLISVIAQDLGKVFITCKGVRNIKSQRLSSSQLFCYTEFTVTERYDRYYLKEAALIENFYPIREDIEKLALAEYICDAAGELSLEGECEDNNILSLALNTLFVISEGTRPLPLIKSAFEMRLCLLSGFAPSLEGCGICGGSASSYILDIDGGMLVCGSCALSLEDAGRPVKGPAISGALLSALNYIVSAPPKRLFSFTLDKTLEKELAEVTEKYFLYHVERGFDTLNFYNSLINK